MEEKRLEAFKSIMVLMLQENIGLIKEGKSDDAYGFESFTKVYEGIKEISEQEKEASLYAKIVECIAMAMGLATLGNFLLRLSYGLRTFSIS